MCSAHRLMVLNVCVKFHENMSSGFKVMERTRKNCLHTKGNNSKSRKSSYSSCVLHVASWCLTFVVKFHENMSSCFKVMERTRKLLTDTHTHTHREKTKTLYPHGILRMPGV